MRSCEGAQTNNECDGVRGVRSKEQEQECQHSAVSVGWVVESAGNTERSDSEANLMLSSAAGGAAAVFQEIKHQVAEVYLQTDQLTLRCLAGVNCTQVSSCSTLWFDTWT